MIIKQYPTAGHYPVLCVLVFLPRNFLDFWNFLPTSWQLFLARFARFRKIFQDRGKKSKKIFGFLGKKTKKNLGFLAKKILGFLDFLPRSWQLILARFARICKISQDRGKKSKKILGVLGNKSKNNQDLGKRNKKVLYQSDLKSIDILWAIQGFSKMQLCYIWSKMHCVSNGIQHQVLLLLDIILSLENCERSQKWQQPVPDHFSDSEKFFIEMYFLDNGLKSQQWTVQLFWNRIKFKGLTIDFKGSNCYFGQSVWYWIKGSVPRFEKIHPDTNNESFMWITHRRRWISASYLRKPQAIVTCGDFCLHPRVNLRAEQDTCSHRR